VSSRSYRLDRRAETSEENRQRILDAAYELIAEAGFHPVSLEAVAERAGVARVTVYRNFGSKRGLFEAVTWRVLAGADLDRLDQARTRPDVVDALRDFLRENCRLMSEIGEVIRTSLEVARGDPEVEHLLELTYLGRRRESLEQLARRLRNERALAPGWTDREVVDALMVLTSLEAFDTLTRHQGRAVSAASKTLFKMSAGFLRPSARTGR
jgi:AcrR family transcriptional regulator